MASTAITPTHLEAATFADKVSKDDLETYEVDGYIWARGKGKEKDVLYRTYGPKWAWLYQVRRVATNANAAGNPIIVDVSIASGMTARLVSMIFAQASAGNHSSYVSVLDEDNNVQSFMATVAAAGTAHTLYLPAIGTAPNATNNLSESLGMLIGPGQKLSGYTSGASANANDTVTIGLTLLLPITAKSDGSDVSWSHARSTDTANITLAASTISEENSMQAVLLP